MADMQDRGVLYIVNGTKHLPVLVVSVFTLRKHWLGPIHIAVGDDGLAKDVARLLAKDSRLEGYGEITWARWEPPSGQRGDGWRQKTLMQPLSRFSSTIFADADTLFRGDIAPLFTPEPFGVTLTQFADWKSNGRKISGRIDGWKDVAHEDVVTMQSVPLPAINTGVLSWRRSDVADAFFREWRDLTARKPVFINDELAAQLLFHRHNVRVLDSRWNYSPIHAKRDDWVVAHFHGKKHVNREQGRAIWLPAFDECCRMGIARINEWMPAGDKRLKEYLCGHSVEQRDGAGTLNGDEEETVPFHDEEEAALP